MSDPWAAFPDATATKPVRAAKPAKDEWADFPDAASAPAAPGGPLTPTGQLHDGDTFRLNSGDNARLFGVDAFELAQQGRSSTGAPVPLGVQARASLAPFAVPGGIVTPTGDNTYGRPVASLSTGGADAGSALLRDGLALTAPQYLRADPERFADYTQEERLARQNFRGAHALTYQTPEAERRGKPEPWADARASREGDGSAVFFDDATPFAGLKPDVEKGYLAIWKDMASKPDDLIAYAKTNGFSVDPKTVRESYASRAKTGRPEAKVNYLDPPRVLTDLKDGVTGATLRGFGDPINILDEAGAVVNSLLPGDGRENVWSSDRRFGDVYANNLDQNRSILASDDTNHPWARFGGQMMSGLAFPGASVEGVGLAAARTAMRGGASRFAAEQAARSAVLTRLGTVGAIEGGLAGGGAGEDLQSRLLGATALAPIGGVLGVGAGVIAPRVAEAVARRFSRAPGEQVADNFAARTVDPGSVSQGADLPPPVIGGPLMPEGIAMMATPLEPASLPGPSFTGGIPRMPDMIDVNAGPRPLLADATDAQRLAQAEGVRPSDVIARPASDVDTLAEADRIAAGRIAPVRAPNEADELARRNIQSQTDGTRTIPKRGPLDLVTWLRSQGGIKAQGGELQHYGIDNMSRDLDFAKGENRFGPLVSNDGMGYDDAAHRAWEAGYFPDLPERPTIPDFLDALNATHTGRNRAFHPDDLAEIDSFERARQQRYDVEAAEDRGAPLAVDRGQPVDMTDMDANAAPVSAYEEWGDNAPSIAGNLRLDKLDSPQAIKRALVETHQRVGGFDAATRGRITQAETASLASDLGMTADDLLKRRKGQAFNAEEALASRQILARSATDLVNMAKRISRVDNPGDEAEGAFRQAWLRHAAIQEQVAGMTAEAGRALQQFRQTADSRDAARVLSSLGDSLGGSGRIKDVADRIVDLEKAGTTPAGINQFALRSLKPGWMDKGVELYINSLLSGPQTHAVNILSNTLTSLSQIPEHVVGAGIGSIRRMLPGQGDTDQVLFSEIGSRATGMLVGAKEGIRAAARSFITGNSVDAASKVENQSHAIPGLAGQFIRTPTRLLSAEDEFFKSVASRMELTGLAMRQARSEGLTGKAARDRASDLVLNPSDDLLERSFEYARYLTFQTPLENSSLAAGISRGVQRRPILKIVIPFVKTPVTILKFAASRSPMGVFMKSWQREFAAGGARRDMAVARMMIGTGVGATMYEMASAGHITGGGPSDQQERQTLQATGWQPYSLKVGDRYYSYARLDPFATTIGTAADLHEMSSKMDDDEKAGSFLKLGAAIVNNLSSKTWLSGLSSALEAVNDPGRYLDNFVARTAGSIAIPAVVGQIARVNDPMVREARSPVDRIRSRVPGLSDNLRPRLDVFGQPIKSQGGLGPDILSPIWTSSETNDPVAKGLVDAKLAIGKPAKKNYTPEQYHEYEALSGSMIHEELAPLIGSPTWVTMDSDSREKLTKRVVDRARETARSQLGISTRKRVAVPGGIPVDPWDGFPDAGSADSASDVWAQFPDIN